MSKKQGAAKGSQRSGPVLVGVDFSDDSRAALTWAGEYAGTSGAELLVLHVVHDPAAKPGFYRRKDDKRVRPMVEVARDKMTEFLKANTKARRDLKALQTADTKIVSGLPAGRIVEVAEKVGARLIVVGSQGRTGLPLILLGSVAERVAQLAPIPVVIVKRPATSAD
jgi:nucleotide-binding universal stress UspA family protein